MENQKSVEKRFFLGSFEKNRCFHSDSVTLRSIDLGLVLAIKTYRALSAVKIVGKKDCG